ncbi:hypothetical protein C7S17_2093 [Burkholderia thailandensis]|nr:hypothetical protein [Burkholderia thailandensis]
MALLQAGSEACLTSFHVSLQKNGSGVTGHRVKAARGLCCYRTVQARRASRVDRTSCLRPCERARRADLRGCVRHAPRMRQRMAARPSSAS